MKKKETHKRILTTVVQYSHMEWHTLGTEANPIRTAIHFYHSLFIVPVQKPRVFITYDHPVGNHHVLGSIFRITYESKMDKPYFNAYPIYNYHYKLDSSEQSQNFIQEEDYYLILNNYDQCLSLCPFSDNFVACESLQALELWDKYPTSLFDYLEETYPGYTILSHHDYLDLLRKKQN